MSYRSSYQNGSGGGGGGDFYNKIPPRWLNCPRKSDGFIVEKFVVFKAPLNPRFNSSIPVPNRFHPNMILDFVKTHKVIN